MIANTKLVGLYTLLAVAIPAMAQETGPSKSPGNPAPQDAVYLDCSARMGEGINHFRIGISTVRNMAQHNGGPWIAAQVSTARVEYRLEHLEVSIQRNSGRMVLKYDNGDGYLGSCTPI